ncbi:MAG: UDP-N-acetylglucosamine 2-epimerase (non-hydrolyzing) [Candidatus ainarchaeum sp.]|nr:UDP-N-acetylglucosamine 2-epimerase (non-hydrolyzing) [Candidatus ainarchaeum sp.]
MRLLFVFGTRPEIIKIAPVVHAARKAGHECRLVHTGQHYSPEMSAEILADTGIKEDANLGCSEGSAVSRLATMLSGIENELKKQYDCTLAEGDTDSVLAAALASHKHGTPFAHIEAGLRSFDRCMPEENNRVLTDQVSDFLFAPTKWSYDYLLRSSECRVDRVFLTGNTIMDAMETAMKKAAKSDVLSKNSLGREEYAVVTIHRAENVDKKERLAAILSSLEGIDRTIVFPMHPRTEKRIKEFGLGRQLSNLKVIKPLGYIDFIALCMNASFIISDSGGIQEECTAYKKPVVLVRDNTERPEVLGTFVHLAGADKKKIQSAISFIQSNHDSIIAELKRIPSPYGDGKSGHRMVKILEGYF